MNTTKLMNKGSLFTLHRCPFCHDTCSSEDENVACHQCLARHHRPCWEEGGCCASCSSDERMEPRGRAPLDDESARKILRAAGYPASEVDALFLPPFYRDSDANLPLRAGTERPIAEPVVEQQTPIAELSRPAARSPLAFWVPVLFLVCAGLLFLFSGALFIWDGMLPPGVFWLSMAILAGVSLWRRVRPSPPPVAAR